AYIAPRVQELGTHCPVELDGRDVPVEHFPLQAGTAFFDGYGCEALEQCFADAETAKFGENEKVLQVKAGPAEPRGIVEEIEREACRQAVGLRYEAEIKRIRAEAVTEQVGLGDHYGVRLAFIGGQCANENQNLRDVRWGSRADRSRHLFILGCDG